ncbi:MAG: hypothetical protein VB032_09045, partial [Burkholderiaceae bacterium]|nr:hypothetical protein [Burkholderiaceae bacterium]
MKKPVKETKQPASPKRVAKKVTQERVTATAKVSRETAKKRLPETKKPAPKAARVSAQAATDASRSSTTRTTKDK